MVELSQFRLILAWTIVALVSGLVMFLQLLPIQLLPRSFYGPNLLLVFYAALVLRAPQLLPIWLAAILLFLGDVFFLRPLGLWALCVLVFLEALRSSSEQFRDRVFLAEWGSVALGMIAVFVCYYTILTISAVPFVEGFVKFWSLALTVLLYPLFSFGLEFAFKFKEMRMQGDRIIRMRGGP